MLTKMTIHVLAVTCSEAGLTDSTGESVRAFSFSLCSAINSGVFSTSAMRWTG